MYNKFYKYIKGNNDILYKETYIKYALSIFTLTNYGLYGIIRYVKENCLFF